MPDQPTTLAHARLDLDGLGAVWLVWSDLGLVRVDQLVPPSERELDALDPGLASRDPSPVPARDAEAFAAFARGEAIDLATLPVELRGTAFQERVWTALRAVPRGRVRTYAGLASDVGAPRAMRAVGLAMAKNPLPLVVPCHRVIAHGSRLGGYSGGLERKRALLALEGVHVEGDHVLPPGQLDLLG